MFTLRGWWLLFVAGVLLVSGVYRAVHGDALVLVVALAIILWLAAEWLLFAVRVQVVLPRLRVERLLSEKGRPVELLWAGQGLDVEVRLSCDAALTLGAVVAEDRLPNAAEAAGGSRHVSADVGRDAGARIAYHLRCPTPGPLRFEGVRVTLHDAQGFFRHTAFLRQPRELLVLPAVPPGDDGGATFKRSNTLLPPGIHRVLRAGSGSELLDLRDYRPGDPPKQIAWKPSARRDRLITKEFESEVPVRATLLVDVSESARLGPPSQSHLGRLVSLAAAMSQAALSDRDLVGLVLFDEHDAQALKPARGRRHLIDLLRRLAAPLRLTPATPQADPSVLLPLAWPLAQELYPDLLRSSVNRIPTLAYWRPVLDGRFGWFVLAFIFAWPFLALASTLFFFGESLSEASFLSFEWLGVLLAVMAGPVLGLMMWAAYGLFGFLPPHSVPLATRKRLSALLSGRAGLGPGGVALLMEDDAVFAAQLQRFLNDHQVAYPVPLYDADGRYRFAGTGKVSVLADALVRAVGRARDNELFVILADLAELGEEVAPLTAAVRVALARHHQVLVVCPWLPGVPAPPDADEALPAPQPAVAAPATKVRVAGRSVRVQHLQPPSPVQLRRQLRQAATDRYHRAFEEVRRQFGRMGVLVVRAEIDDPVRHVLGQLDRLRKAGRRRR